MKMPNWFRQRAENPGKAQNEEEGRRAVLLKLKAKIISVSQINDALLRIIAKRRSDKAEMEAWLNQLLRSIRYMEEPVWQPKFNVNDYGWMISQFKAMREQNQDIVQLVEDVKNAMNGELAVYAAMESEILAEQGSDKSRLLSHAHDIDLAFEYKKQIGDESKSKLMFLVETAEKDLGLKFRIEEKQEFIGCYNSAVSVLQLAINELEDMIEKNKKGLKEKFKDDREREKAEKERIAQSEGFFGKMKEFLKDFEKISKEYSHALEGKDEELIRRMMSLVIELERGKQKQFALYSKVRGTSTNLIHYVQQMKLLVDNLTSGISELEAEEKTVGKLIERFRILEKQDTFTVDELKHIFGGMEKFLEEQALAKKEQLADAWKDAAAQVNKIFEMNKKILKFSYKGLDFNFRILAWSKGELHLHQLDKHGDLIEAGAYVLHGVKDS